MICHNLKKFIIVSMSVVSMIILSVVCIIPVCAQGDCLYGDANNDGTVDIRDCTYIQKCINKSVEPENYDCYMWAADLDNNSSVDVMDVTILQKFLAEIYLSIPISSPTAPTAPNTSTAPTAPTTQPITDDDGYNNHVYKP